MNRDCFKIDRTFRKATRRKFRYKNNPCKRFWCAYGSIQRAELTGPRRA